MIKRISISFFLKLLTFFWLITIILIDINSNIVFANEPFISINNSDTTRQIDSIPTSIDTISPSKTDNSFDLKESIFYNSDDSIFMDLAAEKVWLFGNAKLKYEDLSLSAHKIMIDFKTKTLYAWVGADKDNNPIGIPDFNQGGVQFKSNELSYNFETQKGLIKNVVMEEGDGYIHGSVVKRINENVTNIGKGAYTTCNLRENPHFALRYTKAKIITGNKIVTGPAYIEIENIPLPLALPFGLFPNKKGRSSGLIIPQYGESANRGFYLENGGYYWGISDYLDLSLVGDIYTRGSWALKPKFNYTKRYKYSGSLNFNYAVTVLGVKGTSDYSKQTDFFINWSHRQDSRANPNSVFSASVQAGTSSYNQYNPSTVNDYLNNNFASSISYNRRLGNWGNVTASARQNQNISSKSMSISLPEIAFNVNRFYPFKHKIQKGKAKWYEKISVAYNMDLKNEINAPDSLIFTEKALDMMQNGVKHNLPINASFKLLKYLTWSNIVNYNERWYSRSIEKIWIPESISQNDTTEGYVRIDTISGFKAARDFNASSSISTTIYGMKQFKKGYVRAIRHVVYPSVGMSYSPDFSSENFGYFKNVQTNQEGDFEMYSIFGGTGTFNPIYGYPSNQKNANINFGLKNSLEMKVRSKKDTITGVKKVILIENFSLGTSYNIAKDSLRWAPINITANTTLFKKVRITFSGLYDLYALNEQGRQINQFYYIVNHKLLRFVQSAWNLNFSYNLQPNSKKKNTNTVNKPVNQEEIEDIELNPQNYINWNNPWSLRFDYRLGYVSSYRNIQKDIDRRFIQTVNVAGDISVTKKWKFTVNTGYDLQDQAFTFTQLNIYRDLHCWEMRFSWIPYGQLKSWNFQINAKSSLLQDLKLTRKKDFRDNLQF